MPDQPITMFKFGRAAGHVTSENLAGLSAVID